MGVIAKEIPRGYQSLFTPVSLEYPLSVFNKNSTLKPSGPHWAERVGQAPPGGVWVGVWFSSRLYYPFSEGPGQHIIQYLKNKKCENERSEAVQDKLHSP